MSVRARPCSSVFVRAHLLPTRRQCLALPPERVLLSSRSPTRHPGKGVPGRGRLHRAPLPPAHPEAQNWLGVRTAPVRVRPCSSVSVRVTSAPLFLRLVPPPPSRNFPQRKCAPSDSLGFRFGSPLPPFCFSPASRSVWSAPYPGAFCVFSRLFAAIHPPLRFLRFLL